MNWTEEKEKLGKRIVLGLYKNGMIKTWYRDKPDGWTLSSKIWSPFYIKLRLLSSYPELLKDVGYALGRIIREECKTIDRIIGVAYAGIPIAISISLSENIPSCFTRKLQGVRSPEDFYKFLNEYGEHSLIEGMLYSGERIALIDDLTTKVNSIMVAIEQLKYEIQERNKEYPLEDLKYSDVVVLLDREQGAREIAKHNGITLHPLIPFKTKGIDWLAEIISSDERYIIKDYLRNNEKYQDTEVKKELYELAIGH